MTNKYSMEWESLGNDSQMCSVDLPVGSSSTEIDDKQALNAVIRVGIDNMKMQTCYDLGMGNITTIEYYDCMYRLNTSKDNL